MNLSILPFVIILIQVFNIIRLIYTYKYGSAHIPSPLIELTISAVLHLIFLISSYFFYFNTDSRNKFWLIPIIISLCFVIFTFFIYVFMMTNKYK